MRVLMALRVYSAPYVSHCVVTLGAISTCRQCLEKDLAYGGEKKNIFNTVFIYHNDALDRGKSVI